jgi:hypothetical protein
MSDYELQVTIRCRDYIRKIAVYQERVAVQVTNQIIVYELNKGGAGAKGQYRVCARINGCLECNLLVLTSEHITLCQVLPFLKLVIDPFLTISGYTRSYRETVNSHVTTSMNYGVALSLSNSIQPTTVYSVLMYNT